MLVPTGKKETLLWDRITHLELHKEQAAETSQEACWPRRPRDPCREGDPSSMLLL